MDAQEENRTLTPDDIARSAPGGPVDVSTVRRWMREGFRVSINGCETVFQLEHITVGRQMVSTVQWRNEFFLKIRQFRDQAQGLTDDSH